MFDVVVNVVVWPAQPLLHECIPLGACKHAVCACMRKYCVSIAVHRLEANWTENTTD